MLFMASGILFCLSVNRLFAETPETTLARLKDKHALILNAAKKFDVSAQTLSAIIFVERTLNYNWIDDALDRVAFLKWRKNSSMGFCQVKAKTAFFIEKNFTDSTGVFYPGKTYHALLKISVSRQQLADNLMTDSLNVCYAAAYLRIMQSRWQQAGFAIGRRPGILGTLYSTGLFHADGTERLPNGNPQMNHFGRKVKKAIRLFDLNGAVKKWPDNS